MNEHKYIDSKHSIRGALYTINLLWLTKAFDRVNHWTLFRKLLNQGVPVILIRILLYWYRTQTFCIKWGSTTSEFFNVSNGVRQGGILSPYLLIVYIDDLSNMLNSAGIGCHIHNCCINHVFYMLMTYVLLLLVLVGFRVC